LNGPEHALYLGFGSNDGDRLGYLRRGVEAMAARGLMLQAVSPVVESPALLPAGSPWEWNRPFLNCVARFDASRLDAQAGGLAQLRSWVEEAQAACGRPHASRWAPRPLDIDILLWGARQLRAGKVAVPHPDLLTRNFVLSPLAALAPALTVPGDASGRSLLDYARDLPHHIPLWMGILNITPDSFSDGGRFERWEEAREQVDIMREHGVHIIDVGAESTRPGASPLTADEEWQRLQPMLSALKSHLGDDPLRPRVSVDTYHASVAERCLALGVEIINDVGGLQDPAMVALAASSDATFVAMHNLGIPADREVTLPVESDPVAIVEQWVHDGLGRWKAAGIPLSRLMIDPGIGFGKDALQSLHLLRHADALTRHGVRVLVGHSRKSFMKRFTKPDTYARDLTTLGASLHLCQRGVDVIRVHDVPMHTTAYRGWSHLVSMPLPPAERV
jgi:2-amino-4-hydroxy-6-hydroxymethyldihydropteridine diphosphokinase/dihydropteroate synthase